MINRLKAGFRTVLTVLVHFVLLLSSIYCIWGWLTLNDIRKICRENNWNYEEVAAELAPNYNVEMGTKDGNTSTKLTPAGEHRAIDRYLIPFLIAPVTIKDAETTTSWSGAWGAILEPFVNLTENTCNALTAFSLGFLISLLIVGIEALAPVLSPTSGSAGSNTSPHVPPITLRRIFLRPLVGAFSAQLVYLIILSGGSIIWNQASTVNGLSLGVISYVGAVYCERFTAITSVTA